MTEQLDSVSMWSDLRKYALDRADTAKTSKEATLMENMGHIALDYINTEIAEANLPFIENLVRPVWAQEF